MATDVELKKPIDRIFGLPVREGIALTDDSWLCPSCDQIFFAREIHFCDPQRGLSLTIPVTLPPLNQEGSDGGGDPG